jgi:hypothetical protein
VDEGIILQEHYKFFFGRQGLSLLACSDSDVDRQNIS